MEIKNRNILISGAGIAGLTLAYWLKRYNYNPVLVEKADSLREGGYMIDFWGSGFDVAEKMEILEQLKRKHYNIPEIEFVNENGKRVGSLSIEKLRKLINYRHFNMLRGDLAKVLYNSIKNDVEIIYNNSINLIEENENFIKVHFENGKAKEFDLLIGADGLHSNVRKLIFGDEQNFEKFMGYYTSSFIIDNYKKNDRIFLSYTIKGKQAGIYSISEDKLSTFFIFKKEKINDIKNDSAKKKILINEFSNAGWDCSIILQKMSGSHDFYFDSVSQIKMEKWFLGRVCLLGDACQCVSLIAGQGAALAMAGAYVLAGELSNNLNDYEQAFVNYQKIMNPEILKKQKVAENFAESFVPDSSFGIWTRNIFTKLMFLPFISKFFIKKFFLDSLSLKKYY